MKGSGEYEAKTLVSVRWLVLIMGLLVILLGWLFYRYAPVLARPVPRWTVYGKGQYYGTCSGAAQLDRYDAELEEDIQTARVTREQAHTIVNRVIVRHYGLPFYLSPAYPFLSHGPKLVWATFPDGERRLAWYQVVILDDGGATLMGRAAAVYLDARTGEPLVLITDVVVGDPWMTCGG
jgi:hypothetical protein